jgi:hypothetical protein
MIRKNFTIVLPDEPYKVETTKNIEVTGTYEGNRYLVVRTKDGIADSAISGSDQPIVDMSNYIEEGHAFMVLDATENTFAAAYLSHNYTTTEVPNYIEETAAGETFEYEYDDHTGVLEQIYMPNHMPVDSAGNFGEPIRRTHFLTRESVFSGFEVLRQQALQALAENDYSPEQEATINNYIEWLSTAADRYADVEHWKIVFPVIKL